MLSGAGDLLTKGLGALHDENLRAAVLALRQQVRLGAASGRWFDEYIAGRGLAEVLLEAGEFDRAADHAVTVGETRIAKNVTEPATEHFKERRSCNVKRAGQSWPRRSSGLRLRQVFPVAR